MDRPEQPETPSIFSRPDREVEFGRPAPTGPDSAEGQEWTIAERRAPNGPIRPPLEPRAPQRSAGGGRGDGPSRRMLVALGGGAVVIVLLAAFIGFSLLNGDGAVAGGQPSPSASSTSSAAADASAASSASPSPSATPAPAVRLTKGQWATVTLDAVNVRSNASLDSALVGSANRGEVVYILDEDSEQADGLTWYRAVASPGVAGWMAAHSVVDQNITPDAPTTSVRWCSVPDGAVFEVDPSGPYGGGQPELLETAHVGGLPIATKLLGSGGSGVIELAWGTQDPVCLDLAITDGEINQIALSATIEACGYPFGGAPALMQFGTGAVGTGGVTDSRRAVLDQTVIGYDPFTAGPRANLSDVMSLAASQGLGADSAEMCITASASGPATEPRIEFNAGTTQCAWISSRTDDAIVINHPDGWVMAELRLTEGSFADESVTPNSGAHGKLYRISADRGVDGALGIGVRANDCAR